MLKEAGFQKEGVFFLTLFLQFSSLIQVERKEK